MDVDITSDYGKKASGGGAALLGNMINAFKDKKDEDENLKVDRQPRKVLVATAAKLFHKVINKLPGWKVVPYTTVVRSKTYHSQFNLKTSSRTLASIAKIGRNLIMSKYVTPPKMHVIEMKYANDYSGVKKLGDLAKALKVDAVAIVHVALAYNDGWISVGSITRASPMANAQVLIVSRKGEVAVLTDGMTKKNFSEVDGAVWVAGRKLKLDKKARGLYAKALNMKATSIYNRLKEELTAVR